MNMFFNHKKNNSYVLKSWQNVRKGALLTSFLAVALFANAFQQEQDAISKQDTSTVLLSPERYPLYFKEKGKEKLVESIGYVKGEALRVTPLSSINNSLAGRIAGLRVTQDNGEPGNYGTSFSLRNRTPLILIDGVPRDPGSLIIEHVESVTVLKDAIATTPLGSRGANGVILITTRKQAKQNGLNVEFTTNMGVAQPLKMREQVSASQYAELYNEALANDGRQLKYSQQEIETYKNGSSPYLYPNNKWQDQLVEKQAPYRRYVLTADGKSAAVSYFLSADYMDQDGLLKQAATNAYSTNADYQRFGLRANVAVDLSPGTSLALNLYGSNQKKVVPGGSPAFAFAANTNSLSIQSNSLNDIFNGMINTPANAYPVFNPSQSLGGNQLYQNNLWGQATRNGYSQSNLNEGMADITLKKDLGDVVKGWWAQGTASYTMQIIHTLVRTKSFPSYELRINSASGDTTYRMFGLAAEQSNNSNLNIRNGSFFVDLSTGLTRSWGEHVLDVALHYQSSSATFSSQLPFAVQNGIARATYSLSNKYVFDVVASYSGNNWYKKGHRFNLYPAAGFAWNVHNENFFNKNGLLSNLKLKASYGLTGNIAANYHSYMYTYSNYGNAYYFGASPGSFQGVTENQIPYTRTTEKTLKFNVGLDMGMFDDRASVTVDYYRDNVYDQLMVRGNNTGLFGTAYPEENLGKLLFTGVEATAGWHNKGGKVNYFVMGNIAFQHTKNLFSDQQNLPYAWMGTEGNSLNQIYGYTADGFVSQAGSGPVVEGYKSVPGDLKYKDLNGDGVINFYDRTAIAPDQPQIFYGVNAGITVKGFDLSVLVSGVSNRTINLTGNGEWEFQNNGLASAYPHHLNRWTPQTAATATYPRLTVGGNPNNHVSSTYWLQSADFLRLKSLELGYNFQGKMLTKAYIKNIRVFVSGFNLLTFSNQDRFDPETLSYGYPIQRIINAGLSIKF